MKKLIFIIILILIGFSTTPIAEKPDYVIIQRLKLIKETYDWCSDNRVKRDMVARQAILLIGVDDEVLYWEYLIDVFKE